MVVAFVDCVALHPSILAMGKMRGIDTVVEVCAPVFIDPEGGRVRG